MKNSTQLCLVAGVLGIFLSLYGCNPPASPIANPSVKSDSTPGTGTTGTGSEKANTPVPSPIPTQLQHDAFMYNGFNKTTQLSYLFSQYQGDTPKTGFQTSVVKSVAPSLATYSVKRSGSFDLVGDEELEVRPDGVYLVSSDQGSPSKPVRLMPATVRIGTVWDYDYILTKGDVKMSFKGKARAEKEVKLKVTAGEFETLMVSETAAIDKGGTKGTVSSKTWYAKGIGVVQMKTELKDSNGKIVTSSIELSGTGGK